MTYESFVRIDGEILERTERPSGDPKCTTPRSVGGGAMSFTYATIVSRTPSQIGVGQLGLRRAEGPVLPIVAEEVVDAAETVAPSHHVARDLLDFDGRIARALQANRAGAATPAG